MDISSYRDDSGSGSFSGSESSLTSFGSEDFGFIFDCSGKGRDVSEECPGIIREVNTAVNRRRMPPKSMSRRGKRRFRTGSSNDDNNNNNSSEDFAEESNSSLNLEDGLRKLNIDDEVGSHRPSRKTMSCLSRHEEGSEDFVARGGTL